jgi:glutathione S-transferase
LLLPVAQEEFAKIKPSLPACQLPVLTVDGKVYCQSKAMEHYAAVRAGLYPTDPLAVLTTEMVREHIVDANDQLVPILYNTPDPAKKAELLEAWLKEKLPRFLAYVSQLPRFSSLIKTWQGVGLFRCCCTPAVFECRRLEKVVADNGGEYVVGASNSYGDVAIFNFANQVGQLKPDALEGYPSLQAIKARIGAIPAVAAYLTPSA